MYGVGPVQHGFGPQPVSWRPPFQLVGHSASPASRPMSAAPRPSPDTAAIQRPPVTGQSAAGQPGMQFVPTQVITMQLTTAVLILLHIAEALETSNWADSVSGWVTLLST